MNIWLAIKQWCVYETEYPMVPESCCIEGADKQKCQGQSIIMKGPPNYGPAQLPKKFESHLHTEVILTDGSLSSIKCTG